MLTSLCSYVECKDSQMGLHFQYVEVTVIEGISVLITVHGVTLFSINKQWQTSVYVRHPGHKHPRTKTPRHKPACAIQCQEECNDLYIGETKQPLN